MIKARVSSIVVTKTNRIERRLLIERGTRTRRLQGIMMWMRRRRMIWWMGIIRG
jgi:hypothetical protein